jgi:NAD+ kinase
MLHIDPYNPRAQKLHDELDKYVDFSKIPINVVFGGDGYMLKIIREYGSQKAYLGINAGTLGFLMNDIETHPSQNRDDVIQKLNTQQWRSYAFPRLQLINNNDSYQLFHAVNDVYLARTTGQSANLRIDIDGVNVVEKLMCDGVIIATSLGSTAYSSSAGGSPCHPLLRGIHITPISPRSPRLRPFMVPQSSVIEIETLTSERRPTQVVCDGQSLGPCTHAKIKSGDVVHLTFLEGHNFTETLVRKSVRS